jgi:Fe-S-cluster containining protein
MTSGSDPPPPDGPSARGPTVPEIDLELVRGFAFACRPDCGLCCFASPRVSSDEAGALLRIVPEAQLIRHGDGRFIASRPDGGACQFLSELRCRVHAERPAPCREFPIEVHVGERLQASLVLSCPGLDLGRLGGVPPHDGSGEAFGLSREISSVRSRVNSDASRRLVGARRRHRRLQRRFESEGRWVPESETRSRLQREPPWPEDGDFGAEGLPRAEDGLERLPLFFDARPGPVAIADALGGAELLEVRTEGGVARSLGVFPTTERRPRLTDDGARLLRGYLRYWLGRDRLFGTVLLAMADADDGDVLEWTASELRAIGATTLARAILRARARGEGDRELGAEDVARGIRATDQDLLDRPTWGDRL